jgi:hypothetical protein
MLGSWVLIMLDSGIVLSAYRLKEKKIIEVVPRFSDQTFSLSYSSQNPVMISSDLWHTLWEVGLLLVPWAPTDLPLYTFLPSYCPILSDS